MAGPDAACAAEAVPAEPVVENAASRGARQARSARSTVRPAPHRAVARATSASATSRIVAGTPSAASEVTALSGMPHGTMCPNIARSGWTLSARPCKVRPRLMRTPMAAILRGVGPSAPSHTPG